MSENLSALSFRQGISPSVFERMADDASPETIHRLGEDTLFGDAMTLGAASFYDVLNPENAAKKIRVCNGSACLCAGTQQQLQKELAGHFDAEEIGGVCCLGRCHEGRSFQYQGRNFSGMTADAIQALFTDGAGDPGGRHAVVSILQPALLTAPFPGTAR